MTDNTSAYIAAFYAIGKELDKIILHAKDFNIADNDEYLRGIKKAKAVWQLEYNNIPDSR